MSARVLGQAEVARDARPDLGSGALDRHVRIAGQHADAVAVDERQQAIGHLRHVGVAQLAAGDAVGQRLREPRVQARVEAGGHGPQGRIARAAQPQLDPQHEVVVQRAIGGQALVDPRGQALRDDWVLWVELWLRSARDRALRPVAARLYARLHAWFADTLATGIAAGELRACDVDRMADRLLALIDGYGLRVLTEDPEMALDRARAEIWAAVAGELGLPTDPG